jgi:hypothetical protein
MELSPDYYGMIGYSPRFGIAVKIASSEVDDANYRTTRTEVVPINRTGD